MFKMSYQIPLLKRYVLDKKYIKNYHPTSNLPIIPKRIGMVVARGIEEHLEYNDLNDSYQSAYRRDHLTETAILIYA